MSFGWSNPFRSTARGESRPSERGRNHASREDNSLAARSPSLSPSAMTESDLSDSSSFRSSPDMDMSPTSDGELVERGDREDQEDEIEGMPGQFEAPRPQTSTVSLSTGASTSNVATQEVEDKRRAATRMPSVPDSRELAEAVTVSIFESPTPDLSLNSSFLAPQAQEDTPSSVSSERSENPFLTLEERQPDSTASSSNTGATTGAGARVPAFTSVQQRSSAFSSPPFSPSGGSDANWQNFAFTTPLSTTAPQPLFPLQPVTPKEFPPWIETRSAPDSAVAGPSSTSFSLTPIPPTPPPRGTISIIEVPEEPPEQNIVSEDELIVQRIERIFTGAEVIISHPGSSQYAQGTGVSACGLASLNCARVIFEKQKEGLLGEVILGDVMRKETIEDIMSICGMWTSQAHLDVEDLQKVPYFENELSLQSTNYGRPSIREFKTLLSELNTTSELHSAVAIITRPPEIIACFKIPTPRGDVFVIFDSHPRPLYSKGAAFIFNSSIDKTAARLSKILAVDQSIVNDPGMDWQAQLLGNFSGHIFTAKKSATITSLHDARRVILELGIQVLMKDTRVEEVQTELQALRADKERLEAQLRTQQDQKGSMLNRIEHLTNENNQLRTRASSASGSSISSWWSTKNSNSNRNRNRNRNRREQDRDHDREEGQSEEEDEDIEKDAIIESLKSENERLQKEMHRGDEHQGVHDAMMKSLQEEMIRMREMMQNLQQPLHDAANMAQANVATPGGHTGGSRKGKEREILSTELPPVTNMELDLDEPITLPPDDDPQYMAEDSDQDIILMPTSHAHHPVMPSGQPEPVVSLFDTPTPEPVQISSRSTKKRAPSKKARKSTDGPTIISSGSGRASGDVLMSSVLGGFYRSTSQGGSGQEGQTDTNADIQGGARPEPSMIDARYPPVPSPPGPERRPSRPPSYAEVDLNKFLPTRPPAHPNRSNMTGSFMERQRLAAIASRSSSNSARAQVRDRMPLVVHSTETVEPLPAPPSVLTVPAPPLFSLLPTSESPPRPSRLMPVGRLGSPNRRATVQRAAVQPKGKGIPADTSNNVKSEQEDEDFRLAAELQNQWNQDDVRTQQEIERVLQEDEMQGFGFSIPTIGRGESSSAAGSTGLFGASSFFDRIRSTAANVSSSDVSSSSASPQAASISSKSKGKQPIRLPAMPSFMPKRPTPVPVPIPSSVAAALNADTDEEDPSFGLFIADSESPPPEPSPVAPIRPRPPPAHPARSRPRTSAIEDALYGMIADTKPNTSTITINEDAVVQSLLEDMRRDQRALNDAERLQKEEQKRFEQSERDRQLAETLTTGTFECGVCFETMTVEDVAAIEGCNHAFCRECLREYIRSKINERRFPIQCPICIANKDAKLVGVIHEPMVQLVGIPEQEYEIYVELQLVEFSVLLHCRQCKQSAFVDKSELDAAATIICPLPNCSFSWCKQCNQQVTFGGVKHSCDGSAELDHLMLEQGWKKCPGCNTPVQKTSGCNHMTCISPGCNSHFCYTCGRLIIRGGTRAEVDGAIRTHYNSRCELFMVPPE